MGYEMVIFLILFGEFFEVGVYFFNIFIEYMFIYLYGEKIFD